MKQYDPKRVSISFAGFNLNEHIADGTFISFEPEGPDYVVEKGGDGEKTRVRTYNDGGRVTLTLKRGSGRNAVLTRLSQADRLTGIGVGLLLINDPSGGSQFIGAQAFIAGTPSFARGTAEGETTWVFEVGTAEVQELGHAEAGEL